MGDDLRELAKGFRKRTWVTAKLAAKVGVSAAKRQLRGRDANAPTAAQVVGSTEAARELVAKLGQLKGLVMKVGQMASYLPGALPDEAQDVLAALQAQSTAMDFEAVRGVIEAELGGAVADRFEDFEERPFAAASIGQVHRARFEGRPVAVKVQYPGIEEVLASDLSTLGLFAKMGTLGLPIDGAALVKELEARILEECDYEREADNQARLGALLMQDAGASVPGVVRERSSRRVLTTELVDAMPFDRFRREGTQAAKNRAAEVIFRACFQGLFQHGVYNGDPHPGNYLFGEDGHVTFLDFGCVRRFEEPFIETWKALARSILDGDRARFPGRFEATGLVGTTRGFDWDHQWEVMQYLYRPFIERDPFFTYTDDYVRQSYGLLIFDSPNQRKIDCPPEWLLLNRLQWGLNAVLSKLEAEGPWPVIFGDAARGPFVGEALAEPTDERQRPVL
ncbi:MAG: AarF/ABC1/UbiB kinase family protein [Sandaracinaceae bacterium]|nr:AarF/ABC1/UbiB kinase family protein [Sandaracinaceae bacterium]